MFSNTPMVSLAALLWHQLAKGPIYPHVSRQMDAHAHFPTTFSSLLQPPALFPLSSLPLMLWGAPRNGLCPHHQLAGGYRARGKAPAIPLDP